MKATRLLPFAFTLLLAGCASETLSAAPGNTGNLTLTGRIANWSANFGASLTAETPGDELLGSGSVNDFGDFNFIVTPPVFSLAPINPCPNNQDSASQNTLALTPGTLRAAFFNLFTQTGPSVSLQDAEPYTNRIIYLYADQSGTVQGQVRCISEYYNFVDRYNLSLSEGWNAVNISALDISDGETIFTWELATPEQTNAYVWYVYNPN